MVNCARKQLGHLRGDCHGLFTAVGIRVVDRQLCPRECPDLCSVPVPGIAVIGKPASETSRARLHWAAPMTDVVGRGSSRERFAAVLMGTFASVSLLLAALGLYGVLAHTVRERTQEIGIRMALGATTAEIRALVLQQVALILGVGLVFGSAGALMLGRWLTSLVFQIRPSDPRVMLATASLLTVTGLIAAWLPARRASRVEPRVAIQEGY
jgi:ABC-type antimicrobial peptide transport system permease subunit